MGCYWLYELKIVVNPLMEENKTKSSQQNHALICTVVTLRLWQFGSEISKKILRKMLQLFSITLLLKNKLSDKNNTFYFVTHTNYSTNWS